MNESSDPNGRYWYLRAQALEAELARVTEAVLELANQLDDEENGAGYGSGDPHPVAVRIRSALAADGSEQ